MTKFSNIKIVRERKRMTRNSNLKKFMQLFTKVFILHRKIYFETRIKEESKKNNKFKTIRNKNIKKKK